MNKLKSTLVILALALSPLAIGAPVGAVTQATGTCPAGFELSNTGPDSTNICVSVEEFTCEIDNNNKVIVTGENDQKAASGTVKVDENGIGGGALSGNASNNNNVNFDITIENGVEGSSICSVVATVPVIPPVVPEEEKKPEPAPEKKPVPAPEKKPAPALAKTTGDSTMTAITSVLGVAAVVLASLKIASVVAGRR